MKYVEVRKIYKDTINEVLENTDTWLSFLKSASWNFKYNFDDQILIYAQRPDATACAEMTEWNNKIRPRRWVNKDSKGIAIYAKEGSELPLRFVFDVSDTHNYRNTPYKLWEIKPEYESEIIESLEAKFGDISSKENLIQVLYDTTYNMVVDNIPDYIETIEKYKKGTPLENLEHEDIQAMLLTTLWASVFYMTISRCGINVEEHTDKSNFEFLKYFKNTRLTTILGTATSDIAEMGLREIAKTVRNLQLNEINKNRTFAQKEIQEYSNNESKNIEGGIDYEQNRIRETRGLSNSEHSDEGGNTTNREIRNNEEEISNGTQQSRIYDNESRENFGQTFNRDTGNGNENGKSDSRENGETGRDNRRNETDRPNEMGSTYEQLQDGSRGTSSQRSNLQLDLLTEEEQKQNITEAENASVFSFTQEMIDSFLKEGSGFAQGKFRIYEQISKSLSSKENADFLKNEYGIGGRSRDEFGLIEDHNSKGITLKRGYEENAPILRITWLEAEKRIRELISSDRYFNDKEKEEYEKWLKDKNIVEISANEKQEEIPEEYIYRLADRVFIGTDEFEIININDKVITIADVKFPLFLQELPVNEFERKMKENPYNNHLKKSNRDDLEEIEEETITETIQEPLQEEIEQEIETPAEEQPIIPKIKRQRRNKIEYFDLHPEIPLEERNNYRITNDQLGEGTPREKYQRNIEAIKVLKKCEEENRYATPEEQEILAQYIGWGGLPEAFDSRNDSWKNQYEELKVLLTEKEYKEAKESTLTAFYTPPIVINSIYKALENMGLQRGNILEPSCRSR